MKQYVSANEYMQKVFGCKVYKLSLDGGFTCPNRDGTCGTRGCIFCKAGSSDFSVPIEADITEAIESSKSIVGSKCKSGKYIAYFQSYSNTYAPVQKLTDLYTNVILHPDIVGLDIATRPDCINPEVVELLRSLNAIKPVWVELGLQTIHEHTAAYIRRGYPLASFDRAVLLLKVAQIHTIVHMIIGLPGETCEQIYETASYIGHSGAGGIKLHLLHVLKDTDLATEYLRGAFQTLSMEEYISLLEGCIRRLPPEMVIHRLTGDGAKRDLLAPLWSADKKRVLNAISKQFDLDQLTQGSLYVPNV